MSFDVDEDILQDFLVEAGEILEQLQEQLVDLENNPGDKDLLNAIFRGYHTVKGGAGFLSLTELVEICHGAENVFDVMRNGQRSLTPELMDTILQATDVVVEMFEKVKMREPLEAADATLVETLHKLSNPETPGENIFGDTQEEAPAAEPEPVVEEETFELEEDTATTENPSELIETSQKMSLKRCWMSCMAPAVRQAHRPLNRQLRLLHQHLRLHPAVAVMKTLPTMSLKRCSMSYTVRASLAAKLLHLRPRHRPVRLRLQSRPVMKKFPMKNLKPYLINYMVRVKGRVLAHPKQKNRLRSHG